jgi:hypothetical protein
MIMTQAAFVEYETLREESAHARGAQQAILQWSLAAFGVIFAGALRVRVLSPLPSSGSGSGSSDSSCRGSS